MIRVAILISGSGSNMVALADSMRGDHPARPCLVVSNRPDAAGLRKARARGIPTACVDHRAFADRERFEAALAAELDAVPPDLICLAGFMRVLGGDFVTRYAGRILNIHPSLLPKYKGLDTHARAIAAGDAEAGCSVHEVTAALDGGPVLGRAVCDIAPGETPQTLAAKVIRLEHRLYPHVLRRAAQGQRTPVTLSRDGSFIQAPKEVGVMQRG